jgi:hypothetical protein
MSDPGALDPDIRKVLDEQLDACSSPEDEALIARVRSRVMAAINPRRGPASMTVLAADGPWEPVAPGVQRKPLWSDGVTGSWMLRLDAGARLSGHDHTLDEECVVLEGYLHIAPDVVLRPGDFHVVPKGNAHGDVSAPDGALLYLRGALAPA